MKTYQVNGKTYTEDEVIAIHRMWQDVQDRETVSGCIELAIEMIGDDDVSEFVSSNKSDVIEQCMNALPEWGVWQDECLSQNCLLLDYLIADKLKEMYVSHCEGGNE